MANRAAAILFAFLLGGATGLHAQPSTPGSGVTATQAWSRATPPGAQAAAIYVTLKSPVRDKLVAVTTPAAQTAQIHQMTMNGDVMVMREVAGGLVLPPGQPVSLQPGGYHIMLTGLAAPLKLGQTFPIRLTFENSQPIELVARVAALGATTPP